MQLEFLFRNCETFWQVGGEVALRVLHSTRFPNLRELHMSITQFDDAGVELLRAFCIDSAPVLHTLILSNASLHTASFVAPAVALCRLDLSGEAKHNNIPRACMTV